MKKEIKCLDCGKVGTLFCADCAEDDKFERWCDGSDECSCENDKWADLEEHFDRICEKNNEWIDLDEPFLSDSEDEVPTLREIGLMLEKAAKE